MTWYLILLWVLMYVSGATVIVCCTVLGWRRLELWRAWRRAQRAPHGPAVQRLGEDFELWEAEYKTGRFR